jgi:hypothetical protein
MPPLIIDNHSPAGWQRYTDTFGFVPDPMILRAGEVFLNGERGSGALKNDPMAVWQALEDNLGGLVDFFDILVTRDHIPLINYGDTFDRTTTEASLVELLGEQVQQVEISYQVYNTVKKGALTGLAELDPNDLRRIAPVMREMNALRYDWHPSLKVADGDPALDPVLQRLKYVTESELPLAHFLLGGLIFNGFAKASDTTHYVQPKRSRFLLGLTAAPDKANELKREDEQAIFDAAEARFKANNIYVRHTEALPPVLPYLVAQGGEKDNARELLKRTLEFRASKAGSAYRELAKSIRKGGVGALRALDASAAEHRKAIQFLEPYSKLDQARSIPLDLKYTAVPGLEAKTTLQLALPTCIRVWLNDYVPFGGIHKTLRRMWMEAEAYRDLSRNLRAIWARPLSP